jgi:hypothetical protein
MRHGVLCVGMDVGLCPVSASNATALPARFHARSRICGRPKLLLLARSWIRVWYWLRGRVLGRTTGILWIWRTVRPVGIWLVRWLSRLWGRAFTGRCPGAASDTAAARAPTIQEKVLTVPARRQTRLSRPKKECCFDMRHAAGFPPFARDGFTLPHCRNPPTLPILSLTRLRSSIPITAGFCVPNDVPHRHHSSSRLVRKTGWAVAVMGTIDLEVRGKSHMVDRFQNPMLASTAHVGWSGMPTPRSRL